MASDLSTDLLLSTLNGLREAVDGVRDKQDSMKDQLHAALLENTEKVMSLDARVAGMESSIKVMKKDTRKEARRWGAVGGAAASGAALVAALVRALWIVHKP